MNQLLSHTLSRKLPFLLWYPWIEVTLHPQTAAGWKAYLCHSSQEPWQNNQNGMCGCFISCSTRAKSSHESKHHDQDRTKNQAITRRSSFQNERAEVLFVLFSEIYILFTSQQVWNSKKIRTRSCNCVQFNSIPSLAITLFYSSLVQSNV